MIFRACLAAALVFPACSWAWDEEAGAVAPRLLGQLPLHTTIDRIDIALHGRSVTLTYHGQHNDKKPQTFTLSRYSPPFAWQGVAADYPDLHFPELKVKLNGRMVPHRDRATALFEGDDVTAELQKAKLDPLQVALTEEAVIDATALKGKSVRRLFSTDMNAAHPLWQVMYSQSWRPILLANGPFSIQVTYNLRPAKSEVNTNSPMFTSAVMAHCGNVDQVKALLKDENGHTPDAVAIESMVVPLQLANMAPASTFIATSVSDGYQSGLRLAVTLACGPEDTPLLGRPALPSSKTKTGSSLSVLEIFIQS